MIQNNNSETKELTNKKEESKKDRPKSWNYSEMIIVFHQLLWLQLLQV